MKEEFDWSGLAVAKMAAPGIPDSGKEGAVGGRVSRVLATGRGLRQIAGAGLGVCLVAVACNWAGAEPSQAPGWTQEMQDWGQGVHYFHASNPRIPLTVQALILDRAKAGLKVESALARGDRMGLRPLSYISSVAEGKSQEVVGGVNGDFFFRVPERYRGDPVGLQIHNGEILSAPWNRYRSAFGLTREGQPIIGSPKMWARVWREDGASRRIDDVNAVRWEDYLVLYTPAAGPSTSCNRWGAEVVLTGVNLPLESNKLMSGWVWEVQMYKGNATIPSNGAVLAGHGRAVSFLRKMKKGEKVTFAAELAPPWDEVLEAVGGGPHIVRDGKTWVQARSESFYRGLAEERHPRTAIGYSDEHIFMVAVDGRRPGRSIGVDLWDLARIMRWLGAKEAINLDGGGSTTLVARGRVLNSPSDGWERATANALLVFATTGSPAKVAAGMQSSPEPAADPPSSRLARADLAPSPMGCLVGVLVLNLFYASLSVFPRRRNRLAPLQPPPYLTAPPKP